MSEPKLISPMLDNFAMGGPISNHDGVRCCPAMENNTDDKYIVKIISIPASPSQLDALLLTGAYPNVESALTYFKTLSDDVVEEVNVLNHLSQQEGFLPYSGFQVVPMDDGSGFDVYLLSSYRRTLEKHFNRQTMTHLAALNLGLDLCAALSVCRRSGYLYVALKPSNIFVTDDQNYRIGDLGFIRLESLPYAFLPDKYRSAYTAPEIADAFSSLNTTIDIYAAGLILYQAYNNGALPQVDHTAQQLPAPMYADYEMSEIILKACAFDPKDRWQSPVEMGQALVSYMQRNGVNDTPIVPQIAPIATEDVALTEIPLEETATETSVDQGVDNSEQTLSDNAEIDSEQPIPADETVQQEMKPDNSTEIPLEFSENDEEDFENLSFLSDDELLPEQEDISYTEISPELSKILEQADDLASHQVPSAVIAPEAPEITLPQPSYEEDPALIEEAVAETVRESLDETNAADEPESEPAAKKKKHGLRAFLIVLLILGLLAAGAYFFRDYYLISIESIELSGSEDQLTVFVNSDISDSVLTVVCSDSHGNQFPSPVIDGKAVFTGLVPDTGYNIKVVVSGLHRITGDASTAYSTPAQTNIVQFNAVAGSEDGSVILGFTIDGPDSDQWNIHYQADGEEEKVITFPSHMVTITGLTVGKEYTFKLVPESDLYLTGSDELNYTARKLVYAENLTIDSCMNNTLTASWAAPADTPVESWNVHCYNGKNYDETIITSDTTAIFKNLDHADSFTVEVTASGMSVSQRTFVEENTVTISNVQIDNSDPTKLLLTWDASENAPAGLLLTYTVDGSAVQEVICMGNSAEISPAVPNANYQFVLQDINGAPILNASFSFDTEAAQLFRCDYDGYEVTGDDMQFSMCLTPVSANWNRYYLSASDYTTNFAVGDRASFLVKLLKRYGTSSEMIETMFVIRDASDKIVSFSSQERTWTDMWYLSYCELDIPALPEHAGDYTVEVYFNGAIAAEQAFTVTS